YSIGLGWVLLSMTQVATGYFVLLILGKKFAIVTRRFRAVTLVDFLKERYKSTTVVLLAAFCIFIFFFLLIAVIWVVCLLFIKYRYISTMFVLLVAFSIIIFLFSAMSAQWVGGAYLIQLLTGISYTGALFIFTISVLIYVIIGGFRAVALTDTIQGIVMV